MKSQKIDLSIKVLADVVADLRLIEAMKTAATSLDEIAEYEETRIKLRDELCQAADNCLLILDAYISECHNKEVPVFLEYYRVKKAIQQSQPN